MTIVRRILCLQTAEISVQHSVTFGFTSVIDLFQFVETSFPFGTLKGETGLLQTFAFGRSIFAVKAEETRRTETMKTADVVETSPVVQTRIN